MAPLGDIPIGLNANYLMCWSIAVFPEETPICLPKTCCLPNVHFLANRSPKGAI